MGAATRAARPSSSRGDVATHSSGPGVRLSRPRGLGQVLRRSAAPAEVALTSSARKPTHRALLRVRAQSAATQVVTKETKTSEKAGAVRVKLCVARQVAFGLSLKVVGAGTQLGEWQAQQAKPLVWSEGHVWTADFELDPGSYEFKVVTATADSVVEWEAGSNRIVQVPSGVKGLRVDCDWGRTTENRISVTDPHSAAARQKRAAAAKLLTHALKEVTAAAAAAPAPSVLAARRAAAGAAPAKDRSKSKAAEELEREAREALKELEGLVPPELIQSIANTGKVSAKPGAGSSSGVSTKEAGKEAGKAAAKEAKAAAEAPAKEASSSTSSSASASRSSWRQLSVDEPAKEDKQEAKAEAKANSAADSIGKSILEAAKGEPVKEQPKEQAAAPAPAPAVPAAKAELSAPPAAPAAAEAKPAAAAKAAVETPAKPAEAKPAEVKAAAEVTPAPSKDEAAKDAKPAAAEPVKAAKPLSAAAKARAAAEAEAKAEAEAAKAEAPKPAAAAPKQAAAAKPAEAAAAAAPAAPAKPAAAPAAAAAPAPAPAPAPAAEAKPADAKPAAAADAGAAKPKRFSFASLRAQLEKEDAGSDKPKAESKAEAKADAAKPAAEAKPSEPPKASSAPPTPAPAAAAKPEVKAEASASAKPRKFSWRDALAADEGSKEEAKPAEAKPVEAKAEAKPEPKPEPKPEAPAAAEEEDTAARFARLLQQKQQKKKAGASAAAEAAKAQQPAAPVAAKAEAKAEAKPEVKVGAPKPAQAQAQAGPAASPKAPETPAARDAAASSSGPPSPTSGSGASGKDAEQMGNNVSREVVNNVNLDRLLGAWDEAWSKGKGAAQPASASRGPDGPPSTSAPAAGTTPAAPIRAPAAATGGPFAAVANAARASSTGSATGAAGGGSGGGSGSGAAAMNGTSSGESLFSLAERLTSMNTPPTAAVQMPGSDDASSPDMTMRAGGLAAMGVDRQHSLDNRSSYLSQSLLAETGGMAGSLGSAQISSGSGSLKEGGAGSAQSASLLQQMRAASAAAKAAADKAAANGGAATNGSAAAAANASAPTFVPPLPATPKPPGILDSTDDTDTEEGFVPPLPSTPPPPSYLGGGSSKAGARPGLPATPVSASILASGIGAPTNNAAEDLLRRAQDADAVLEMLRGNLPLTPIARGVGGPLSMAEGDDEDDDESGGGAGGKRRRSRNNKGVDGAAPALVDNDPLVATQRALADAAVAWDKTRAAFAALQANAAALGLSPETISHQASRLLQNLPLTGAPGAVSTGNPADGTNGANGSNGSNGLQMPAVSQLATNLVSGISTVGSSLTEQLRRAAMQGGTAVAEAAEASVAAAGSGLLSGLVGPATLPPGCAKLVAGAHMIPHVDKVDKGGEDAYFISRVALGGVGVADGVSGWADEGIDPAEYPRTLMRFASDAFEGGRGTLSAADIIRYAQYRTYLKGSSTVCLALMKPGRQLEVANVGDSGVRILRNGKVFFGTDAQQHAFNMPYQLSHPNNVEDPDSADDADVHMVEVQDGDVVMLATDGLFDNVFDEEIEQIVTAHLKDMAAQGRGKAPVPAEPVSLMTYYSSSSSKSASTASLNTAADAAAAANASASTAGTSGAAAGGAAPPAGKAKGGLLSQSLNAAAAAAGGGKPGQYRPEDAARIARALAERAHLHARNPTQRTPWSVTSSQQPNFMWAKFFAKGGGKMDDCTVLVAFVCGNE